MSKQKTIIEKVRLAILKDPNYSAQHLAEKFNTTPATIRDAKTKLRRRGQIEPYDKIIERTEDNKKLAAVRENDKKISDEEVKSRIIALFKKKGVKTFEELSDHFDKGIGKLKQLVFELKESGYNFDITDTAILSSTYIPKSEDRILNLSKLSKGVYRVGVVSDNHMCSKYERLDVLNAMYDYFEKEGITTVYNAGNWIDGEARFNGQDLLVHGMDAQLDYFIKNYPQKPGITTYYIAGDDHEGWYVQREGVEIGKYAELRAREAGRKDLVYLGYMEADIILKAKKGITRIRIVHPGGGSSYAFSYIPQKLVETYSGGNKPDILIIGHYHKASYDFIRGVHTIQAGTTEDQSPFMRKKRLAAHLGGWIIEFTVDDNGAVTRFKSEFFPFYNTEYYVDNWSYKH